MMAIDEFVLAANDTHENQLQEARDWLTDCGYPRGYLRSRYGTLRIVDRFYDGGLPQFLSDTEPLAEECSACESSVHASEPYVELGVPESAW